MVLIVLCFIAGVISLPVLSQDIPSFFFSVNPKSQNVIEGREARLLCQVSDDSDVSFTWNLNGKPVSFSHRRFQEGTTLRFLRVLRHEDEGSFTCVATYRASYSIISQEARLNVHWIEDLVDLKLISPNVQSSIRHGSNVTLKCDIIGNPQPSYLFYRNSFRIFQSSRVSMEGENTIKLSGVTSKDNGVYSCQAENMAGRKESNDNFILNIRDRNFVHMVENKFKSFLLVKKNQPTWIHCPFLDASSISWFIHQTEKIYNDSRHTLYRNGTLYVPRVRTIDEGMYICVGASQTKSNQTFSVSLKLMYIHRFSYESFEPRIDKNFPVVVPRDEEFLMQCFPPNGKPRPSLRWLDKSGRFIGPSGPITSNGGSLRFTRIQVRHTGNYTCIAESEAGEVSQSIPIVVSVPPIITNVPRALEIEEENNALFECSFKGTPFPITTVIWKKDTIFLDDNRRYSTDKKNGRLVIRDVKIRDAGNYACVVNTTGHSIVISSSAYLTVKRKLKFKPFPKDLTLILHSISSIKCHAEADRPPTVRWVKYRSSNLPSHVKDIQGTLLFDGVQQSDAGVYICIAHSGTQGLINTTVNVQVLAKPLIKVWPRNVTAYEGQSVIFDCVVRGNHDVIWDKDRQIDSSHSSKFQILRNGSLYVKHVEKADSGVYGCTAKGSGSRSRAQAYLSVYSRKEWLGLTNTNGKLVEQVERGEKYLMNEVTEGVSMTKTIIIAVCSAAAYLILVISLTAFCGYRLLLNRKNRLACAVKPANGTVKNVENLELLGSQPNKECTSPVQVDHENVSHFSGISSHPSHRFFAPPPCNQCINYDRLRFFRNNLETVGKLGRGIFGDVYLAKAYGVGNIDSKILVVVKSFLVQEQKLYQDFRREMDMYASLSHEHVSRLLGICVEQEPHLAITEYCSWGDLKQFLLATLDNGKRIARANPLSFQQKIDICLRVAQGLEYISQSRFIHRDVAARNVLISPQFDVKISNLALCKDVYANEYYNCNGTIFPLRWMPPEAVVDNEFSVKSDVWSFGVFTWEVFMSGAIPYRSKTDEEVLKGMRVGDVTLEFSDQCTDEIIEIIHKCTAESAVDRPLFSNICLMISDIRALSSTE